MDNYFKDLASIDCSQHVEKKGQFSYLSWTYAVQELKKQHPDATWSVCRFEGVPFMATKFGVFVEVEVTVNNITHSQIHPVLDYRNNPIAQPSAFEINTSIQRCLVKAIALHGLGLYIYAGEDLPPGEPSLSEQEKTLVAACAHRDKEAIVKAWNDLPESGVTWNKLAPNMQELILDAVK